MLRDTPRVLVRGGRAAAQRMRLLGLACAVCISGCRAEIPNRTFGCKDQRGCPAGFYCDVEQMLCVRGQAPEPPSAGQPSVQTRDDAERTATAGQEGGAQAGKMPRPAGSPAAAGSQAPADSSATGGSAAPSGVESNSGAAGQSAIAAGSGGSAGPRMSVCAAGAARCAGQALEHCASDGTSWQEPQNCPNGCNADRAQCNVCMPGSVQTCQDGSAESCLADGSAVMRKACPMGCRADRRGCLECGAQEHACDGVCGSNTSPRTCGSRCDPCLAPRYATALCESGQCGFECQPGAVSCNNRQDGCELVSYPFENDLGNWVAPSSGTNQANVPNDLALSRGNSHGNGIYSARAAVNVTGDSANHFSVIYWFCGDNGERSHYFDLSGKTTRVWVFVDPSGSAGSAHTCSVSINAGADGREYAAPSVSVPNKEWTSISYQWPSAARESVNLAVWCKLDASTPWAGSVYVDDISLQ